jgi:hypothetical protein
LVEKHKMGQGSPISGLTGRLRALINEGCVACDAGGVGLGRGLLWEEENGDFGW